MKESKFAQPILVPLSDHQIPESDSESDSLGLDLVNLAQPPNRPPSPSLSASGQTVILFQSARPPSPPLAPPHAPQGSNTPLPDTGTALLQPPAP